MRAFDDLERAGNVLQVGISDTQQSRNVIPIIGARTAVQMVENLGALDFELGPEELERLN
jgi:hypothetical protein